MPARIQDPSPPCWFPRRKGQLPSPMREPHSPLNLVLYIETVKFLLTFLLLVFFIQLKLSFFFTFLVPQVYFNHLDSLCESSHFPPFQI